MPVSKISLTSLLSLSGNLNAIDTVKWPFSMILYRLVTEFLSFLLPRKHAVVPTVSLTVPLLPAQIERFFNIPRAINRFPIR